MQSDCVITNRDNFMILAPRDVQLIGKGATYHTTLYANMKWIDFETLSHALNSGEMNAMIKTFTPTVTVKIRLYLYT